MALALVAVSWGLPVGGFGALFVTVTVQLIRRKRRERKGLPPLRSATAANALEELLVVLAPAKRVKLEQQATDRERRDDRHDGAPPGRVTVDLDKGIARIRKQ